MLLLDRMACFFTAQFSSCEDRQWTVSNGVLSSPPAGESQGSNPSEGPVSSPGDNAPQRELWIHRRVQGLILMLRVL